MGKEAQRLQHLIHQLLTTWLVSADPVTICEKGPVNLQAVTSGIAYWKLPGDKVQNSSTLFVPISTYSDNGKYVVINSQNGCTDSIEVLISVNNCNPKAEKDKYSVFSDEVLIVDASNPLCKQ